MSIKKMLIDYSRGINMEHFWRLYTRQCKAKGGIRRDILTFRMSRCAFRHGGYVGPGAVIKGMPEFPHGLQGIFISKFAEVGENCWIYQNVTIGEVNGKAPVIGDNCLIGAGAVVIGDIRVGNNVKIGAGAVVNKDVPDGCTVVPQPMRIIAG